MHNLLHLHILLCVHNVEVYIRCIMCIDNGKYVFIVHYVYVCVFCTLSSVQSVNMYCPYVNCCCFFALSGAPRHLCCGDVTIKVI